MNMVELDLETRDKIVETHTDIKHILTELKESRDQFKNIDKRLRRVENLFLPILGFMSLFAHKLMTWLKI